MEAILENKIKCNHCGEVIESISEHDFKMCKCGKVGVDGGKEYLRRLGCPEDYTELSVTVTDNDPKVVVIKQPFFKSDKGVKDHE